MMIAPKKKPIPTKTTRPVARIAPVGPKKTKEEQLAEKQAQNPPGRIKQTAPNAKPPALPTPANPQPRYVEEGVVPPAQVVAGGGGSSRIGGNNSAVGGGAVAGGTAKRDDPMGELASLRAQQERARKAAEEEMAAQRAQALQQIEARAGFAGLGLSGATSAQSADAGRKIDRANTLALDDIDRKNRDEQWLQQKREINLQDLEQASDIDYDGDGFVGNPALGRTAAEAAQEADNVDDVENDSLDPRDTSLKEISGHDWWDLVGQNSPEGSEGNPYVVSAQELGRFRESVEYAGRVTKSGKAYALYYDAETNEWFALPADESEDA
jgi:hypothetical protein